MTPESKTPLTAEPWLADIIDRLNDISVSQIPTANFDVVNALDKITDELRTKLTAQTAAAQAMEADKARLDWLEAWMQKYPLAEIVTPDTAVDRWELFSTHDAEMATGPTLRAAIDAAIAKAKEAK